MDQPDPQKVTTLLVPPTAAARGRTVGENRVLRGALQLAAIEIA